MRTVAAALALLGMTSPAAAQELEPITDRGHAIDPYAGAGLGAGRIVGMGGAALAMAQGSAGALVDPAAPAVRAATSRDA